MPLILFGNLSTKTGDSPYEINAATDLAAGKGYYSAGVGASTRKYIDPVVLFASVSANYGFKESGLNQRRGSRIIEELNLVLVEALPLVSHIHLTMMFR